MRLDHIKTALRHPALAAEFLIFACGIKSVSTRYPAKLRYFSSFSQFLTTRHSAHSAIWYIPILEDYLRDRAGAQNAALIDVGANIGLHAVTWAAISDSLICCIEPLDENVANLRNNLAINAANYKVFEAIAANHDGTMAFRRNVKSPQNAKIDVGETYPCNDVVELQSLKLDSLAKEQGIDTVTLLKIDTEGAEVKVLEGAQDLIRQDRIDTIFCEVSATQLADFGHSVEELVSLFPPNGTILHSLDGVQCRRIQPREFAAIENGDILYLSDKAASKARLPN